MRVFQGGGKGKTLTFAVHPGHNPIFSRHVRGPAQGKTTTTGLDFRARGLPLQLVPAPRRAS